MTGETGWELRTTAPPGRVVSLVLVTRDGSVVGELPPFSVEPPWWQGAESVVRGAREHHGVEVVVLRLLSVEPGRMHGGAVTYLAEVDGPVLDAGPWNGQLDEHPLRQTWARPGGPAEDLAWAAARLRDSRRASVDTAEQVRTWNLSSLWRLRTRGQTLWLKAVPPFFAHEGPLLEVLQDAAVPRVVAQERGRALLQEVEGEDLYDAPAEMLLRMVSILVELQTRWTGRVEELLALGLADWRAASLIPSIADLVERLGPEISPDDGSVLRTFVRELGDRMAAVEAAAIPDTLVHGDFHPGNFRGDGESLTLLDWGDSGVGHPLLDASAFLDRVPPDLVPEMRAHWRDAWRAAVPGSDAERAFDLLAPVAAARQALIYRQFLDAIEPSEHPYHASDPADWLTRTASLVRAES